MSKPETQDNSHDSKRREFLRSSTLLGATASLMAGTSAIAATADEQPTTETIQPAKAKKGYQLSEHVKAYYRSAAS